MRSWLIGCTADGQGSRTTWSFSRRPLPDGDAVVCEIPESGVLSEFSRHGVASRKGKKRADVVHQPLDAVIVAAPWVLVGGLAYRGVRRLRTIGRSPRG